MRLPQRTKRSFACAALLLLGLARVQALCALERVELELGALAGDDWRLQGVQAGLDLAPHGLQFSASAEALRGADGAAWLRELRLRCNQPVLNTGYLVCLQGRAEFIVAPAGRHLASTLEFVFRHADGAWRATGSIALEPGRLAWRIEGGQAGIQVFARSEGLALAALLPWVQQWYPQLAALSGQLRAPACRLWLPRQGPLRGTFHLRGDDLGFDTEQGRVAAAGLGLEVQGAFRNQPGGWYFTAGVALASGQFLAGPFYTRVGDYPLRLQVAGLIEAGNGLVIDELTLTDPNAITLNASGRVDWSAPALIQHLEVAMAQLAFPGFYQDYLQPLLAQSGFGALDVQGAASGSLAVRDNQLQGVTLAVEGIHVDDAKGRLEFTNLDGRLSWQRSGPPTVSLLSWDQARVYQVGLGPVLWRVRSQGGDFALLQATTLPVLDGALQIHKLEAENLLADKPGLLFDASLQPVSLRALTRALGWPEMTGQLAGRIPELTLEQGVYRLGGQLAVHVFDGLIRVANLRLERPFGVLPTLTADVDVEDLDLERVTSVFTFGKIQGRLQGYVRNLRLLDWRPVHFDATLATPPDDDSEHRISQRAVDTLSSLGGGGASGALSRTFLRIFDDFGYAKLGLSCYLDDNVCLMGGVGPAPKGGYYIVKGSGIPRVDVIGYVERVDWPQLVIQLIEATRGNPPTVGKPDS